jgi:hypothetical protein
MAVPAARQTSRKEAATLYEVLSEEILEEDLITSAVPPSGG